ncbi:MAG: thermonuclease family protein [Pseudomonadota bacterium]|nr:thermonuclease family protein [Pseudomonadota bacterium]
MRIRFSYITAVLSVAIIAGGLFWQPPKAVIEGEVTRVLDGDTFDLGDTRIRIWGIDAPERDTPLYDRATETLVAIIDDDTPVCRHMDTDKYGRTVASCTIDDRDIAAEMVLAGMARDYYHFSRGAYAAEENDARNAGVGLWKK